MIDYTDSLDEITPDMLQGFFVGWPNPPHPSTHLSILSGSDAIELAIDSSSRKVVGFTTGLTDGVITLYISYLEVLPDFQGQGIGSELTRRLLSRFDQYYGINLNCDENVQPFYQRLGMMNAFGMNIRRYDRQSGA